MKKLEDFIYGAVQLAIIGIPLIAIGTWVVDSIGGRSPHRGLLFLYAAFIGIGLAWFAARRKKKNTK